MTAQVLVWTFNVGVTAKGCSAKGMHCVMAFSCSIGYVAHGACKDGITAFFAIFREI